MSWFWLLRPWSYAATLVPFLLAAGLCAGRASLMWANWSVGLLSGLFLQATVNLLNTWGDERSGVDSAPGAFRSTPLLPLVAAPLSAFAAAKARIVYGDCPENPKWRGLERITGAVLLVFGVLYSLSLFLVR